MAAQISDYEKKMIEMRYQMQENKVVMEDCFKDLENWTQDIKVKEKPTKLRRIKKKTIDKKKKKYDNFFNRFNSTFKDYSFDDISNLNKYFIKTKRNTLACHCENTNANIFYGSFKKNC